VRLGVAGAGLIGGSIALRAAELGWEVAIYEPNEAHRRTLLARAPGSAASATFAELAARSTILVLAAPLEPLLVQLGELATAMPEGLELVVDTASVKAPVARAGRSVRGFVPTHPIAGSQRSGPAAADGALFIDRIWAFEPAVPEDARARAIRFIEAMGARPVAIESGEHDRIVALTSHLPQVLSTALGARLSPALDDASVAVLCGTGIRSMLRLAGSSWTVWSAVLRANAVPVAQEVRRLAAILTGVAEALETDVPGSLEPLFASAAAVAERLHANASPSNDVTPTHPSQS
jgi:prephenate dehydrogenase